MYPTKFHKTQYHTDEGVKLNNHDNVNNNINGESVIIKNGDKLDNNIGTDLNFKRKIVWVNVIAMGILHLFSIYGVYLMFTKAHPMTKFYAFILGYTASQGITIGAHRLWSHKSFKCTFGTRFVLMLLQSISGQNCIWIWVRDHRLHHRYADTDADPHNAKRGFFFSHMGWLLSRKHPLVIKMGKTIDMSDLEADKLVMFQKKYYYIMHVITAIIIPVPIPIYFWKEDPIAAFFICYIIRLVVQLNLTWTVNSIAHLWGSKPFDKNIMASESLFVSIVSWGEGWHNYHHTFPCDYKTAERGTPVQITTHFINVLESLGLAYDLKEASPKLVQDRKMRTGDKLYAPESIEFEKDI